MTYIQILYDGPIVKRSDAKARGDKFYFTGKPCKHGHIDKRYTKKATCHECNRVDGRNHHKENYTPKSLHPITYIVYSGPILSREHARNQGVTRYFTGKACPQGHVSQRHVSSGTCLECNRVKYEEMKANNPEHNKELYQRNKKVIKQRVTKWYEENKDWVLERGKQYRKNNSDKIYARNRNRRARVKSVGGTHTANDIQSILQKQSNRCAEPTCRKDLSNGYHVDHIIPIKLGGPNWPENLQCLCPSCNLSKGAKHPIEWAQSKGRLF